MLSFRRKPESREAPLDKRPAVYILASQRNGRIGIMRWSDLDSGFRRNDDLPKLTLMPPTPLCQRENSLDRGQHSRHR